MKKQIKSNIKAHLLRGAFYLLLLLAVCAIPIALAQRSTAKRSLAKPGTAAASAADSSSKNDFASELAQKQAALYPKPASAYGFSSAARALLGKPRGVGGAASVKGNNPLLTYSIDDGTAEDSVGLTNGGALLCLNSFPVSGGNNIITSIAIAWGTPAFPDPTLDGLTYTAVLWSDPNGDGSPTDAVVLASAPGVISQQGTDTFLTTTIPPTMVTTPNFFVGLLVTHTAGQFPAAFDETAPTLPNRSWVSIGGNINNLSDAQPIEVATGGALVGNWLIRAEGEGGGTPSPTPTPTPTCQPSYFENFDAVTPPALPADWTATQGVNGGGFPFWVTSNSGVPTPVADSLPNALFSLDPANLLDNRCDSSTFTYIADAQLTFRQNYDLEQSDATTAFDCGVMEISVNGGAFQDIVTAGGSFVEGGYNHTAISTGFANPCLPSRPSWSGISNGGSGGFETVTVNLPASGAGQPVKVRWRMCSDNSVSHTGWRVDNVAISGECGTPSPTPTATATATATATVAPRETPTPRPRPTPVPR